jgi:hypothetical protein
MGKLYIVFFFFFFSPPPFPSFPAGLLIGGAGSLVGVFCFLLFFFFSPPPFPSFPPGLLIGGAGSLVGLSSMALTIWTPVGKANARLVAPFADDRWEEAVEEVNADARSSSRELVSMVGVAIFLLPFLFQRFSSSSSFTPDLTPHRSDWGVFCCPMALPSPLLAVLDALLEMALSRWLEGGARAWSSAHSRAIRSWRFWARRSSSSSSSASWASRRRRSRAFLRAAFPPPHMRMMNGWSFEVGACVGGALEGGACRA